MRFFDALHGNDHGIGFWDLTSTRASSTRATPTGVSHIRASNLVDPMKVLVVFGEAGQPVYAAEPLIRRSGPFWGPRPGTR